MTSIVVGPVNFTVAKGLTQQFTATAHFSDGSTQDITGSVTWTSSDQSVATISASGMATSKAQGTSTIKATSGGVNKSTLFTVGPPAVVSIAVSPLNPLIAPGLTKQFTATGTFTDNSIQDLTTSVTWSSSDTTIATISNASGSNGLATGIKGGQTTIQAMLGSVQRSTMLNVGTIALLTLVVSPQNPVIADAGATQAFTATGHFSDGSTQNLTSSAAWTSSNTGVAIVVASSGLATSKTLPGQNPGFTSIRAAVGSVTGVSVLSVTNHTGNGFAGVFTQHNDIGRTGQNVHETVLTPAIVGSTTTFGKKFAQTVDGYIFAQPLYVPGVLMGNGTAQAGTTHNVVIVATEGDSVYAFDADNNTGANANPLWHASLIDIAHGAPAGATTATSGDVGCSDLVPQIGITSTPVIDPSTGTIYVEAKSKESGNFVHRLHALDLTTGKEKSGGPTTITATVSGITFDGLRHMNRPGLLWLNGIIYLAYASHCDNTPYFGWLFAYDAASLAQQAVINVTPTTSGSGLGGIWMAGAGLAADSSGNIFAVTGNGTFDTTHVPATQLGDTIFRTSYDGTTLPILDYFTPYNQGNLAGSDADLGSGGVLLLPDQPGSHPHELVEVGKEGTIYLVDRDKMTANDLHYCPSSCNNTDAQIVQENQFAVGGHWSIPAYWNNSVYFFGVSDFLKLFPLMSNGRLSTTPGSSSTSTFAFPGATPSISASGNTNGIVWAIEGISGGSARLHAYDATNVATELYDSSQTAGNRDQAGPSVKFVVPTIANGKVYIGTQTELDVYGTLP